MSFAELLAPGQILPDLKARNKAEVLGELSAAIVGRFNCIRQDELVRILENREAIGTTAVGEGVAIPHGKLQGIDEAVLVVGRSLDGINFAAADGQPCHIFFLVLAPEGGAGQHLKLLAQIARRAKDSMFRQNFMQAGDAEKLLDLLKEP